MATTKRKKRAFSPFQYAMSNVFYAIMYIIGAALILGALAYAAETLQPRVFGEQTTAQATKYYAYDNKPENGKLVQYSYVIHGHTYYGEHDIGERAYVEQPKTFTIWYMPDDPVNNVYVSIRDYWEAIAIGLAVLAGALFLYLPSFGRSIDRTIEAGKEITPAPGCICGHDLKLQFKRNNTKRKAGLLRGGLFLFLAPLVLLASFIDNSDDVGGALQLIGLIVAVYTLPLVWQLWAVRTPYRGHTLRCYLHGAWLRSLYGE